MKHFLPIHPVSGTINCTLFQDYPICKFKFSKSLFSVLLFLIVIDISSFGQITGDYKSNAATLNWDARTNWLIYTGTNWTQPSSTQGYPGYSSIPGTVTILTGQTVTLNVNPPNSIINFDIQGTGKLNINSSATNTIKISGNITFGTGPSPDYDPINMKVSSGIGIFNMNGTSLQTITGNAGGNLYFYQLYITGTGGVKLNHDIVVMGDLTVYTNSSFDISTYLCNKTSAPASTFTLQSGSTLKLSGSSGGDSGSNFPILISGSGSLTYAFDPSSTVEYYGAAQTVSSLETYGNLTLSGSGVKTLLTGTTSIGGNLKLSGTVTTTEVVNLLIGGDLNIGSGTTFDLATYKFNRNTSGGTLTNAGTLLLGASSGGQTGSNFPTNFSTLAINNGTVSYNKSNGSQTIFATPTYNNLTIGNTSGSQTAGSNLTVNGTLTTTSGGVLNLSTNQLLGTLSGIANAGTIQTQNTSATPIPTGKTWNGTFVYNAATGLQTVRAGSYNILTLSNTSGTQTADGNLTANTLNNNTNTADVLNMSMFTLAATTINNTGTIKTQNTSTTPLPSGKTWGGTVQYDATAGNQTIMAGTYGILNSNCSSNTNTASGNITATTLNTTSGGTLNMGVYALTVSTPNNAGTIRTQNTTATPFSSGKSWSGMVTFDGSSAQILPLATFNNLTITNNAGVSLSSSATVTGNTSITPFTSRLIIPPAKCLNANTISTNNDPNQILIQTSPTGVGGNGSLIFQNGSGSPVQGTVEMYSKASVTDLVHKTGYKWQFIGIPLHTLSTVSPTFDGGYVRQMHENEIPSHWEQLNNSSSLSPFTGYEISQLVPTTYIFQGQLENGNHTVNLTYTAGKTFAGQNLIGNSYTAAIEISKLNFTGNILKTVYIYNTGSHDDWVTANSGTSSDSLGTINTPGQYNAIPQAWAGYAGLQHQIPSMQAFLVKAGNSTATLTIPYSSAGTMVSDSVPQRTKGMLTKSSSDKIWTIIDVKGSRFADRMWIFTEPGCTHSFDNGWDGEKFLGSGLAPQLYAMEADGDYQVNSVDDINNTYLGFQAGEDSLYTLTFTHQNLGLQYGNVYLVDSVTQQTIDITASGTKYTFLSLPADTIAKRFKIVTNPDITTKLITPNSESSHLKIFSSQHTVFIDNTSDEKGSLYLYDMTGRFIQKYEFTALGVTTFQTGLTPGTYLVKGITKNMKVTKNISLY